MTTLLTAVLFALAAGTGQAPGNEAWSRVRLLPAGQQVRVVVGAGPAHEGEIQTADEASITVLEGGNQRRLLRADVRQISTAGKSRKRNVLIGLAIGTVASVVAVSSRCSGESAGCNEGSPAYFYPLAGAGALAGALVPPRRVWREIYSAP